MCQHICKCLQSISNNSTRRDKAKPARTLMSTELNPTVIKLSGEAPFIPKIGIQCVIKSCCKNMKRNKKIALFFFYQFCFLKSTFHFSVVKVVTHQPEFCCAKVNFSVNFQPRGSVDQTAAVMTFSHQRTERETEPVTYRLPRRTSLTRTSRFALNTRRSTQFNSCHRSLLKDT